MINEEDYAPYDVKQEKPERQFKVLDNGDVEMNETTKAKVFFSGRNFITFYRKHLQDKEKMVTSLKEEAINKVKKNIEAVDKEIEKLKPLIPEIEQNMKKEYENQLIEGKVKGLKSELMKKKSDRKPGFLEAMWVAVPDEMRDKVLAKLDTKEKNELLSMKIDKKKEERKKKK